MGWPQITWIALTTAGLALIAAKHGEPQKARYNIWATSVATAITAGLLYAGGFFG